MDEVFLEAQHVTPKFKSTKTRNEVSKKLLIQVLKNAIQVDKYHQKTQKKVSFKSKKNNKKSTKSILKK